MTYYPDDTQPVEPWPAEVMPLDPDPIPPMALTGLPPVLREHVEAVAEAVQVPTDLALLMDLGALAVACQGVAQVDLGSHREPLSLYVLTVLPSGERKSAVVKEAVRPIHAHERAWRERTSLSTRVARAYMRALEKRQDKAERVLATADDDDQRRQAMADLTAVVKEIAEADPGIEPTLLVDDSTPEALAQVLHEQGRAGVMSAEGGLFDLIAGRYSDGVPNLDLVLKAYDAEPVRVHRKTSEALEIAEPHLSLALSVQPVVAERVARNRSLVETGLLPRFLTSAPQSMVGSRRVDAQPVSASARNAWAAAITDLLRLGGVSVPFCAPTPGGRTLMLDPMALAAWQDFATEIEREQVRGAGRYSEITATASKAAGLAGRVAALLHLVEHGEPGLGAAIEPHHVLAAAAIVRVHLEHAARIINAGADSAVVRDGRAIMAWAIDNQAWTFSARDALDGARRRAGGPDRMSRINPALAMLDERGWIRPFRIERPTVGRPPSPVFEINPAVMP